MARASSWVGCRVEGAAESGRRAMKDASGAERTGAGPFHIGPACCRAVAAEPAPCGPKPPGTAALGDPGHANEHWWSVARAAARPTLPAFRLTWAHPPVEHGWAWLAWAVRRGH